MPLNLSRDEKFALMGSLNWDYLDTAEDMLAVVEDKLETSGAFTHDKLFVRSLERLSWYYEESLYPLQDGVMNIISKCGTRFFLTGGTALICE